MQQRRLRLGDVVDDYCPRERRITNHVIVAMIEDEVKQTRCTTCDADHEYKQGKAPSPRRKKDVAALSATGADDPRGRVVVPSPSDPAEPTPTLDASETPAHALAAAPGEGESSESSEPDEVREDDGFVHRRLIRATLPRPEGQVPERKMPEFTMHQPQRGPHGNRPGRRARGGGGQQPPFSGGGQQRFGNRQGGDQRQGGGNTRPGGQGQGQPRARGRKRGR